MEKIESQTDNEIEETFKILSNSNRLKIVSIIANSEDEEVTVNQIVQRINITQPAASQHLKLLKSAKILTCNKKGTKIYYRINKETMNKQKECIDKLFHIILR